MSNKSLIFFSTNSVWGGSEVLWTQTAGRLREQDYLVKAVADYDFINIEPFIKKKELFFKLSNRFKQPSLIRRAANKFGLGVYKPVDRLQKYIAADPPALAIISQGNSIEGVDFMELCVGQNIPFVTITHLVVESKWPMMSDEKINNLRRLFDQSLQNFFVSKFTRCMHEKFIGQAATNSSIIYNPFIKIIPGDLKYPPIINGQYKVALVGRIETYHKGYDLLIEVLSQDKWRRRNICFDIYGSGPHCDLLKRLIKMAAINNLQLNNHLENIEEIWRTHHLLLMPSRLEGQSLTLIEAMNFKRACVVTRVGGMDELIEDGKSGFIAEHPSAQAIDKALENAWEKRENWEQMGKEAYNSIRRNHPENAVDYFIQQLMPYLEIK